MNIAKIYTDAVRQNLNPLYANWNPGEPRQLGDFGILRDNIYIHQGNISSLGIKKFKPRTDTRSDRKYFTTQGGVSYKLNAQGSVNAGQVNANAGIDITFSKSDAVFFNAAECITSMIEDKSDVGDQIMALYKAGKWQREYVVITDIVKCGNALIAISAGNNASIEVQANTPGVKSIDLAKANVDFGITSQSDVGYTVVGDKGLDLLIGLSKIQSKFLWTGDNFRPMAFAVSHMMLTAMQDSPHHKTEHDEEKDLYFGQLK